MNLESHGSAIENSVQTLKAFLHFPKCLRGSSTGGGKWASSQRPFYIIEQVSLLAKLKVLSCVTAIAALAVVLSLTW